MAADSEIQVKHSRNNATRKKKLSCPPENIQIKKNPIKGHNEKEYSLLDGYLATSRWDTAKQLCYPKKKNSIKLGEDTQKKKLRDQEKIKNFYIM